MYIRLLLVLLALPVFAAEGEDAALDEIIDAYWQYTLEEFPQAAKFAGLDSGNDRLRSVTPASRDRRLQAERDFLARLRSLDASALSEQARVNAELLDWILVDSIRAYELRLSRIPFNTFWGFFMEALTASNGVRMVDQEDYEDYLSQLADVPRFFDENIANMREGMRDGFVLPAVVIEGVLPTVEAQVKDDPTASSFYQPFAEMSTQIPPAAQAALRERAETIIADLVIPAFSELADFLEDEYEASATLGASDLPDGERYYAFQVRRYTTLDDADPEDIHQIGLREVARIRSEMQALLEEIEFDGSIADFATFLREDPRFYAATPEDLLKEAAYIAKRIDHRMPGFFGRLPRQPYGIVAVPDEIAPNYTTGAYHSAPAGGSHGGEFWLNTYGLDQRPLYALPALTLHEAVPGHHHQKAIAAEMDSVPDFRKDLYFSAYGEGWALYAERLGVEMGIYRTPYEHFGRLSYEMWRACRLVIDTGLHAKGWSRDQAIAFLSDNTSLSAANIRAEVDRYISWPGQALSYKLGEIRIRELRQRAASELGEHFDLRSFHDALLENGALPIAMLERQVDRYIDRNRPAD